MDDFKEHLDILNGLLDDTTITFTVRRQLENLQNLLKSLTSLMEQLMREVSKHKRLEAEGMHSMVHEN